MRLNAKARGSDWRNMIGLDRVSCLIAMPLALWGLETVASFFVRLIE